MTSATSNSSTVSLLSSGATDYDDDEDENDGCDDDFDGREHRSQMKKLSKRCKVIIGKKERSWLSLNPPKVERSTVMTIQKPSKGRGR